MDQTEHSNPTADTTQLELEPSTGLPQTPQPPLKRRFKPTKKQLALVLVGILILAIGGYLLLGRSKPKPLSSNSTNQTVSPKPVVKTRPAPNLTFFNDPKKIDPIPLFVNYKYFGQTCDNGDTSRCHDLVTAKDLEYSQIGTTKDGDRIITIQLNNGLETTQYLVLDNNKGAYRLLSSAGIYKIDSSKEFTSSLNPAVTIDSTTVFSEFEFPKNPKIAGQKLKGTNDKYGYYLLSGLSDIRGAFYNSTNIDSSKLKIIGEADGKTFYEVVVTDNPTYQVKEFYATYKNIVGYRYYQNGEIAGSNSALAMKWTGGDNNKSIYFSAGAGCGSTTGFVVAKGVNKSSLIAIGSTPGGQKAYQLSASNPLTTELYNKDYAAGASLSDESLKNLTIDQFMGKHGYFLVQNGLDEYVVFLRDDLFIRGGCAKPVVYLYPTTATKISLKVGADVTVSEPLYGDGWKNVLAEPSGKLTVSGKSYDSLFWEGYGHGLYPEITSGTVVTRDQAPAVIRNQLAAQGFNTKEISDFMSFWQPRLPNTPYIRLSWLTTSQMNQLAPLTVSPQPQTVIRAFLDFEGLSKPISLRPQGFKTPTRQGFTLAEWGGLARSGLSAL